MPACYTAKQFDALIGTTTRPTPLRSALWRCAAGRVGPDVADDCLFKALAAAWQVIVRFNADDGPGALMNWLRRFVIHACDDYQRRRDRREALAPAVLLSSEDIEVQIAEIDLFVSPVLQAAYVAELRVLIEVVPLTCRQSACLRAWLDGDTLEEIGEQLCIRNQTVWEHIVAGRRRLSRWTTGTHVQVLEVLQAEIGRTVYQAPTPTGAALAREALAALDKQDARHAAACRRSGHKRDR
jgi:DNA-directed RNA polymerase specialized sigma24 family protein